MSVFKKSGLGNIRMWAEVPANCTDQIIGSEGGTIPVIPVWKVLLKHS